GDYIYASNGDFGSTLYMCCNIKTGEILWRERSIPRANSLLVGDRAVILDEQGVLHLASLSPQGIKIASSFQVLENICWTPLCIAVIAALSVGEYLAAAEAMFIVLVGEGLESYAAGRTEAAIQKFVQQLPRRARLLRDGVEVEVDTESLLPEDVIVVRAGERL